VGDPRLYAIRASNLPALRRPSPSVPRSPFVSDPDTLVQVVGDTDGLLFLGPKYVRQDGRGSSSSALFSFFERVSPFTLLVGRFKEEALSDHVRVFTPLPSAGRVSRALALQAAEVAAKVRPHLQGLFGPAAVEHSGLLILDEPWQHSFSLGSVVAVSVAAVSSLDANVRRARLVCLLAHEYAHSWWRYSAFWQDRAGDVANEALAIALSHEAVAAIEGRDALRCLDDELWAYATYAVARRQSTLRRVVETASGAYAGSLLIDLWLRKGPVLLEPLKELWSEARGNALTTERFSDAWRVHGSPDVSEAVTQAIVHPKPIVASTQVQFVPGQGWRILLTPEWARRDELYRRLTAVALPVRLVGTFPLKLALSISERADVIPLLNRLEPLHLVLGRSRRLIAIHRRLLLEMLWTWATGSRGASARQASACCLVVRSLLALALNPHDPAGWQSLALVLRPLSDTIGGSLSRAAGRRAAYYGEDDLLQALEPRAVTIA